MRPGIRSGRRKPVCVAAVSGGSDSVALALLLHELASRGDAGVCGTGASQPSHPRRGRRRRRGLLPRAGRSTWRGRGDWRRRCARPRPRSIRCRIEVAGRFARQRFFREAIDSIKADRVAVAHTRDDQAETVRAAADPRRRHERSVGDGAAARAGRSSAARRRRARSPGLLLRVARRGLARGRDQSRSRDPAEPASGTT